MTTTISSPQTAEEALLRGLEPIRRQIAAHPLYRAIDSLPKLQTFMQAHVYAVWDFMSLLKTLQRSLTCVDVPWRPVGDPATRRLINEIVLGEESDEYQGSPLSHFELYLLAMESCGADTGPVRLLLTSLENGRTMHDSLAGAPTEAAAFVQATFSVIDSRQIHRAAAAFAFGREDLIPDMFSAFVRDLDARLPGQIAPFRYYLERHIEMDGDEHGPMALQMMRQLCTTEEHWREAEESARFALEARLALWNGIYSRIEASALSVAGDCPQ